MHRVLAVGADPDPRRLIRARARTFYLASLFFPPHIRRDVHLIYAYFRTIDDLADEPGWRTRDDVLAALLDWEDGILGRRAVGEKLLSDLLRVAEKHQIPAQRLLMVIEGARFDVQMRHIDTRDDLVHYSILVAGSVGMIMALVLGAYSPLATEAATEMGVAMQITNILRDVGEDAERGRVYLPLDELRRAGCDRQEVLQGRLTPPIRHVMADLVEEARVRYSRGMEGIPYLEPSSQFAILLAARLYSQILVKIERRNFDVFSGRASLGSLEKCLMALPTYAHHRQLGWKR